MASFRLRDLRLESHTTQTDIAEMLGITQQAYAHYENERRLPNVQLLCLLADYYNVSVDYLLGRTDEKSPTPEGAGLNEDDMELAQLLTGLSPAEFAKAAAYIQGLRDNRGASGAPAE